MNVIFDIGKVLIDFDFDGYTRKLFDEETAAAVTEAMWHNPEWVELDRGVLKLEEALQRFISAAPQYEKEIRIAFAKIGNCPVLKPTTIPLIKELKARGHKVYYLSNYFEFLIHACPWALDFIPYTDGGIFSCYEHIVKPSAEIFALLCERFSLRPEESVFIDDTLKNIQGSEAFGIRGIHYTGQSPEELIGQIER